jgi:hypothetical protein
MLAFFMVRAFIHSQDVKNLDNLIPVSGYPSKLLKCAKLLKNWVYPVVQEDSNLTEPLQLCVLGRIRRSLLTKLSTGFVDKQTKRSSGNNLNLITRNEISLRRDFDS